MDNKIADKRHKPIVVVRGVGDVGSAIICHLFQEGFSVVAHEDRQPRSIRRQMAFCDAVWDGKAELEKLTAYRIECLKEAKTYLKRENSVPLYCGIYSNLITSLKPVIIVDGRIQKFMTIENIRHTAPLTIGVGPGFVAKEHVDFVIESCWGGTLGNVINTGSALRPVAQPPKLNGVGWQRFIRAEISGCFETDNNIGQYVYQNEVVGLLNNESVYAPISGHLRGLLRSGLDVTQGEKICEIDPRAEAAHYKGMAERPNAIAKGVIKAVRETNYSI